MGGISGERGSSAEQGTHRGTGWAPFRTRGAANPPRGPAPLHANEGGREGQTEGEGPGTELTGRPGRLTAGLRAGAERASRRGTPRHNRGCCPPPGRRPPPLAPCPPEDGAGAQPPGQRQWVAQGRVLGAAGPRLSRRSLRVAPRRPAPVCGFPCPPPSGRKGAAEPRAGPAAGRSSPSRLGGPAPGPGPPGGGGGRGGPPPVPGTGARPAGLLSACVTCTAPPAEAEAREGCPASVCPAAWLDTRP